jgi:predicted nucleotidyltransferase
VPLDVRRDHLTIIANILKQNVPDHRVVAFGSRSSGKASNTSDLDLCIMSDERIPFEILAQLRDAFSESNIPYRVDVVVWSTLAPDFREIVLNNCCDVQTVPQRN